MTDIPFIEAVIRAVMAIIIWEVLKWADRKLKRR